MIELTAKEFSTLIEGKPVTRNGEVIIRLSLSAWFADNSYIYSPDVFYGFQSKYKSMSEYWSLNKYKYTREYLED